MLPLLPTFFLLLTVFLFFLLVPLFLFYCRR